MGETQNKKKVGKKPAGDAKSKAMKVAKTAAPAMKKKKVKQSATSSAAMTREQVFNTDGCVFFTRSESETCKLFNAAKPFRHVITPNFFDHEFCKNLSHELHHELNGKD